MGAAGFYNHFMIICINDKRKLLIVMKREYITRTNYIKNFLSNPNSYHEVGVTLDNDLNIDEISHFFESISTSTSLKNLKLNIYSSNIKFLQKIGDGFKNCCNNLDQISIELWHFNTMTIDYLDLILSPLVKSPAFKHFDISQKDFNNIQLNFIANKLKDCKVLESLDISANNLQGEPIRSFCEVIANNPLLKYLNVGRSNIDENEAVLLGKVLVNCRELSSFLFEGAKISGDSIINLASNLNNNIKNLEISSSAMRDEEIISLINVLDRKKSFNSLERLSLYSNSGEWNSPLDSVVSFLLKCKSLEAFTIFNTSFEDRFEAELRDEYFIVRKVADDNFDLYGKNKGKFYQILEKHKNSEENQYLAELEAIAELDTRINLYDEFIDKNKIPNLVQNIQTHKSK